MASEPNRLAELGCKEALPRPKKVLEGAVEKVVPCAFGELGVDRVIQMFGGAASKCSLAGNEIAESEDIRDEMTSGDADSRLT